MRRNRILGGDLHPLYKNVLLRAIGQNYALPSLTCQRLQNTLVKTLYDFNLWQFLDYLYIFAEDSGTYDLGRINWIQPLKPLSATGPIYVHKKGCHGNFTSAFDIVTDKINFNLSNPYACQFAWLTENGGTISVTEHLCAINIANAGNQRIHRISLRTNPRVDYILNATSASPSVLYAGFPLDNHFYHIDLGNVSSSITMSNWINGVNTFLLGGTGTGLLPDVGTPYTQLIQTRAMGLFGGGISLYTQGADKPLKLYQAFNNYMTQLQTLP